MVKSISIAYPVLKFCHYFRFSQYLYGRPGLPARVSSTYKPPATQNHSLVVSPLHPGQDTNTGVNQPGSWLLHPRYSLWQEISKPLSILNAAPSSITPSKEPKDSRRLCHGSYEREPV